MPSIATASCGHSLVLQTRRGNRNAPTLTTGISSLSLGTAIAISGGAASPNMGYHSSPIVTFLMTIFNVRLGWWLGNPRFQKWRKENPKSSVPLLWKELMGQTADDQPWIYLSDGGHFDNLGLYEIIRRGCRTVVVVDTTADPKFSFSDLGRTLRQIQIDFGLRIDMGSLHMLARSTPATPGLYCAVGTIKYSELSLGQSGADGQLLYPKPGIYGAEPADVRAYAAANPVFPHDPTATQFFGEAQLESYRSLGWHCIEDICRTPTSERKPSSLAALIQFAKDKIKQHAAPPPRPILVRLNLPPIKINSK
jgi:hypothetical protein